MTGPDLRAKRQRAGVTIHQVARLLGVSPNTVTDAELVRIRVEQSDLEAMSAAIDKIVRERDG